MAGGSRKRDTQRKPKTFHTVAINDSRRRRQGVGRFLLGKGPSSGLPRSDYVRVTMNDLGPCLSASFQITSLFSCTYTSWSLVSVRSSAAPTAGERKPRYEKFHTTTLSSAVDVSSVSGLWAGRSREEEKKTEAMRAGRSAVGHDQDEKSVSGQQPRQKLRKEKREAGGSPGSRQPGQLCSYSLLGMLPFPVFPESQSLTAAFMGEIRCLNPA